MSAADYAEWRAERELLEIELAAAGLELADLAPDGDSAAYAATPTTLRLMPMSSRRDRIDGELSEWMAERHPDATSSQRAATSRQLDWIVAKRLAEEFARERRPQTASTPPEIVERRLTLGGDWGLDAPTTVPAIWGDGPRVLAAEGEGTMIAGQQGTGKTSIAQQLVLHRHGVRAGGLLGLPVAPELERPTLYLAMDRPRQAQRSLRRMVAESDRAALNRLLRTWAGPVPVNVLDRPESLVEFVVEVVPGCGLLVIDSVKDLVPGIAKDEVGAAVNLAFQHVIAAGVELVALHHQRKASSGSEREVSIDSLYGSTWLTSGLGSVLLITGDPGDVHVEVHHVKQPAEVVGPITSRHDHATGTTTSHHAPTALEVVTYAPAPVTTKEVARLTYGDTSPRAVKRAQRTLKELESDGLVVRVAGSVGAGGRTPDAWVATIADPTAT